MQDDSTTTERRGRMPYSPAPHLEVNDPYDLDDGPPTAPQPAITAFTAVPGPKVGGPADPYTSGEWVPLDLSGFITQQPAPEPERGPAAAWAWVQLNRDRLALPALIGGFAVVAALGVWSSTWNDPDPPATGPGNVAEAAREMLPPPRMPEENVQSTSRSASPTPSPKPPARRSESDRHTAKSGEHHRGDQRDRSPAAPPRISVRSPAKADRPMRPAAGTVKAGSRSSSARATPRRSAAAPRAESRGTARSTIRRERERRSPSRPAPGPGPRWMYQPDPCAHYEPFQRPYCRSLLGTGR
ncbi:hypothetical protein HS048_36455 [Planomonospora sp. ID91781]|uniref:hypothetical protein n=1 Tax=Planomonospora sp. ID91781 TaxID=2738135 RepID=UPI0018C3B66C|nr:hypothetical protein [Planomonospora sp. ID91781]MBG0826161.1 hypothetical protein [Planomonospora sp. ID91781]